jgi:hypothetical protein
VVTPSLRRALEARGFRNPGLWRRDVHTGPVRPGALELPGMRPVVGGGPAMEEWRRARARPRSERVLRHTWEAATRQFLGKLAAARDGVRRWAQAVSGA